MGREVHLVDRQEIGLGDAGPVLAGDLVAGRHVDDVDEVVHQGRAEGQGQIIPTALQKDEVRIREAGLHLLEEGEVHRRVFPDGGVGAGPRLHPQDPLRIEDPGEGSLHVQSVLHGHNVVRHDDDLAPLSDQPRDEPLDEGSLPRPDRAADPDARDPFSHILLPLS